MAKRRGIHGYRRIIQIVFLLLFFALLTATVWPVGQVALGAFLVGDPLIALNSLANGIFKIEMLIALVLLAVPLVAGRAFCGYVCPMGTVIEVTAAKPQSRRSGPSVRARERLRATPTYVLLGVVASLLFATGAFLVFDPLSTLTRAATTLLYPFLDRMLRLLGDVLYLIPALRPTVDSATTSLAGVVVSAEGLTFGLQVATLAFFGGILALSVVQYRLWCRHLCPLGALLGFVGRYAIVGRKVDTEACIQCGKCDDVCPLDAVRDDFHSTDTTRCQLCFECADVCPTEAISSGARPGKSLYSPSRRTFLGAGAVALLAGFFTYTGLRRTQRHDRLVRPPGARTENEFLALCSRCGQCMKVCPTNVLQPSVTKAGIEGVYTPEMDYRQGYCDWSCNECGKVCPTGAIGPLELDAKRETVIGRAYIDRNRCIPWADYGSCLVCEELCPIPDKAIKFVESEVVTPEGETIAIKRPEVLEERCIGCGICEHNCPVGPDSAITVHAPA